MITTPAASRAPHAAAARAAGLASGPALTSGYHLTFGVGVGLVLTAAAVTGTLLRPSRPSGRSAKKQRLALSGTRR